MLLSFLDFIEPHWKSFFGACYNSIFSATKISSYGVVLTYVSGVVGNWKTNFHPIFFFLKPTMVSDDVIAWIAWKMSKSWQRHLLWEWVEWLRKRKRVNYTLIVFRNKIVLETVIKAVLFHETLWPISFDIVTQTVSSNILKVVVPFILS